MKHSYKNISRGLPAYLFISFFLFASKAFARPVALVLEVKGNAFLMKDNKTVELKSGDLIKDLSEIFTEEGSQITFSDNFDHKFHLAGQGQIRFFNKILELKAGYLWAQSYQTDKHEHTIQTVNSKIHYSGAGEGIISFDIINGKTQVLILEGEFKLGNSLIDGVEVNLGPGNFSFIDEKYENGIPRVPTPVGYKSFQKVLLLFDDISPMDKNNQLIRETIAREEAPNLKYKKSVPAPHPSPRGRETASIGQDSGSIQKESGPGEIIFLKKGPDLTLPKKEVKLLELHESKVIEMSKTKARKTFTPNYSRPSGIPLIIYGSQNKSRAPHSIREKASKSAEKRSFAKKRSKKLVRPGVDRDIATLKGTMERVHIPEEIFENSLTEKYKSQMRHKSETNDLIRDLKSFDMDFKKNY